MKNIISIIVIIISLASFIFIVKPGYAEIKRVEAKSNELKDVLINAKKLQSIRDNLLEKQKELSQSDIGRLGKLIPESADNVKLIIDFQNIADKYGLLIETASSQKDEYNKSNIQSFDIESKDYGIISLNFNTIGSYEGFVSFLEEIEDSLRITDIKELSLEQVADSGDYQFSLSLDTYWLKDNI